MHEKFDKAQSLFNNNEFEAALRMFRYIGLSDEFDNATRVASLNYAIKCKRNLQDDFSVGVDQFELVKLLFSQEQMSEILCHLPLETKALNKLQILQLKQITWQVYIALGLLEKAETAALKCLEAFYDKGDVGRLRAESDSMKEIGLSKEIILRAEYMLCILSGDEKELVYIFERDLQRYYSKLKDRSILSIRKEFLNMHKMIRNQWREKQGHKAVIAWLSLQEEHATPSILKNIAVSIFEFLVDNQGPFIDKVLLINYAQKSKRFDFADQVTKDYELSKSLPVLNKLIKKIEGEMVGYSEIPEGLGEDVDYATDLFRSENLISYDSKEKVKKLESEIRLLKGEGHYEKVAQLVTELEKFVPSHDYVKELYERQMFDEASRRLKQHKNIDEEREELLREIQLFTRNDRDSDEERAESTLKKMIEYMDQDLFREAQTDLAMACLGLGFPSLAVSVLDDPRVEETQQGPGKNSYLKTYCLIEGDQAHKALDFLNEKILVLPLNESEYVCFLYMKGEALRALGRRLEALKVFKSVSELNPRYRLVRLRLRESV